MSEREINIMNTEIEAMEEALEIEDELLINTPLVSEEEEYILAPKEHRYNRRKKSAKAKHKVNPSDVEHADKSVKKSTHKKNRREPEMVNSTKGLFHKTKVSKPKNSNSNSKANAM